MASDIELKTIEKRLDGIKEGILRIRTILIVTIIASSAIFFVLFNANFSRVRSFAFQQRNNLVKTTGKTFADQGTEVLLNDWYKSRNIQVNFLGVSVNVTDLPIVGSITLIVITIWYFYSFRQSNRAIVDILRESERNVAQKGVSEIIALRRMIYTSITQTNIFTKNDTLLRRSAQKRFRPMQWLDKKLLGESDRPIWLRGESQNEIQSEPATFTDKLVRFMFYMPFWTTLAIFVREIINLLSSSPVYDVWRPQIWSMVIERHYWSLFLAFFFSGFALLCATYLLVLCNGCLAFSRANTESLWEFNKETLRMEAEEGLH